MKVLHFYDGKPVILSSFVVLDQKEDYAYLVKCFTENNEVIYGIFAKSWDKSNLLVKDPELPTDIIGLHKDLEKARRIFNRIDGEETTYYARNFTGEKSRFADLGYIVRTSDLEDLIKHDNPRVRHYARIYIILSKEWFGLKAYKIDYRTRSNFASYKIIFAKDPYKALESFVNENRYYTPFAIAEITHNLQETPLDLKSILMQNPRIQCLAELLRSGFKRLLRKIYFTPETFTGSVETTIYINALKDRFLKLPSPSELIGKIAIVDDSVGMISAIINGIKINGKTIRDFSKIVVLPEQKI